MDRNSTTIIVVWTAILLAIAAVAIMKTTDSSNPNSLKSRFDELDRVINEDT